MNPSAVLFEQLAAARHEGEGFADAWPDALAAALAVVPVKSERREWAAVLGGMVGTWRDAFDRVPAHRHERALSLLADSSDREPMLAVRDECQHCNGPIAEGKDRRAIFCSDRCRRNASYARTHTVAA